MGPYEFEGTLVEPGETKSFGANGFLKREFALQEDGDSKYPNIVPFVLKKDRCSILDNVKKGAKVRVSFYVSGRAWEDPKTGNTRYFGSNDVVRLSVVGADGENSVVPEPATPSAEDFPENPDDSDMPF